MFSHLGRFTSQKYAGVLLKHDLLMTGRQSRHSGSNAFETRSANNRKDRREHTLTNPKKKTIEDEAIVKAIDFTEEQKKRLNDKVKELAKKEKKNGPSPGLYTPRTTYKVKILSNFSRQIESRRTTLENLLKIREKQQEKEAIIETKEQQINKKIIEAQAHQRIVPRKVKNSINFARTRSQSEFCTGRKTSEGFMTFRKVSQTEVVQEKSTQPSKDSLENPPSISFGRSVPNTRIKPKRVANEYHAYCPNFQSIDSKADKLCLPFSRMLGRSEDRPNNKDRIFERNQELLNDLKSLEIAEEPPTKERSVPVPSNKSTARAGTFGSGTSRDRSKDSKFPSWMQKGNTTSRFAIASLNEKALEMNCFKTNTFSYMPPRMGKAGKKERRLNLAANDEESSECIEVEEDQLDGITNFN